MPVVGDDEQRHGSGSICGDEGHVDQYPCCQWDNDPSAMHGKFEAGCVAWRKGEENEGTRLGQVVSVWGCIKADIRTCIAHTRTEDINVNCVGPAVIRAEVPARSHCPDRRWIDA